MKVLFVTRGYPSKEDPMWGNYEAVQAKALQKRGLDVSIICIKKIRSIFHLFDRPAIEMFEEDGVKVYQYTVNLPIIPKLFGFELFNYWFIERAFYRTYQQYVNDNGTPDVVHAHIITVANHCKLLLKRHPIPFVITEHWSVINYPTITNQYLRHWAKMYFKASQVIAVSSKLSESLQRKFGVDSIVIGNMVDNRFFAPQKNELRKGFTFVSVGNLLLRKGFDLLIKGFAKCGFDESVKLNIVGGGEERDNLQALIDKLGLQHQVTLLGLKTPEEVGSILAQSDCYVLSSHIETFGIVIIEAMAKGLPVVATECGGPEDIVTDENGILVPADDVDALTLGMKTMYNNIGRYNREDIKRDCWEKYSEESITNKIIEVYKKVIESKKALY